MNLNLFSKIKTKPIISILREKYPAKWSYNKQLRQWEDDTGRYVWRCAALAPQYDGDDDTFSTQYWMYDNKGSTPIKIF